MNGHLYHADGTIQVAESFFVIGKVLTRIVTTCQIHQEDAIT